jgi:hypothetical protein
MLATVPSALWNAQRATWQGARIVSSAATNAASIYVLSMQESIWHAVTLPEYRRLSDSSLRVRLAPPIGICYNDPNNE